MHNPAFVQENETYKLLWGLDIQTESPNLGQKTRPYNNKKKIAKM